MTSQHYLDTGQRNLAIATMDARFPAKVPARTHRLRSHVLAGTAIRLRGRRGHGQSDRLIWCRSANLAEFPLTWAGSTGFRRDHEPLSQRFGQRDWRMPNRREFAQFCSVCKQIAGPA